MTNIQSLGGSIAWAAVAAILMLVTFEPISLDKSASEPTRIAHSAATGSHRA